MAKVEPRRHYWLPHDSAKEAEKAYRQERALHLSTPQLLVPAGHLAADFREHSRRR